MQKASIGTGQPYRADIQGLRALAILVVVFTHCKLFNVYGGVDIFFVISGYIVTTALLTEQVRNGRISLPKFWARRMRRLMPIGLLVIASTAAAAWQWGSPLRLKQTVVDGMYAVGFSLNWRLAIQGTDYFANKAPSAYQQYWSLGVEEQYYFIWPALLIALTWLGLKLFKSRALVAWVLAAIVCGSFALSVVVTHSNQPFAYFGFHTRAWELGIGALIAVTATYWARMNKTRAAVVSWFGLALAVGSGLWINETMAIPGWVIAGPVVGAALIILAGCANPSKGAVLLLGTKPMTFLGDMSYGWYLWHWPILIFWPQFVGHEIGIMDGVRITLISLSLSVVTYYTVEQPFRKGALSPWRVLPLGGMAMTSIAGFLACIFFLPIAVSASGQPIATPSAVSVTSSSFLEEAAQLQTLPSNVTPSVEDASKDMSHLGCIADVTATAPIDLSRCAVGDVASSKVVVLFGDSHSWQWATAMNTVGKKLGWRVVTVAKNGCSSGEYAIKNPDLHREYAECDQWRQKAIAAIVALKPSMIILSGQARQEATRAGMDATLNKLRIAGSKMVFLADTPYPGKNVPDCLATLNDVRRCNTGVSQAMTLPKARQMEQDAVRAAGGAVVDMNDWLCTSTVCPVVIGGMIVYFDQSHVTRTYTVWLAPRLAERLASVAG